MQETKKTLSEELRQTLFQEIRGNYRHQGLPALVRCFLGTRRMLSRKGKSPRPSDLDVLSLTILPEVIALWQRSVNLALTDLSMQIIVGDGSGNYRPKDDKELRVLPIYNFSHGTKLDFFVSDICTSDYVLKSDDDIFWTDSAPVKWAMERFSQDPKLAVVSLHPRPHLIPQLQGVVSEAMGAYAILFRRDIWIKENLSFKMYKPDDWRTIGNYFDDADYANFLLVQRGYHVISAPEELRQTLIPFYGTSMWALRILASKGNINRVINTRRPDEHKKAYRTALALLGFRTLLSQLQITQIKPLVPADYLYRTLEEAPKSLDAQTKDDVEIDIQSKLTRLTNSLIRSEIDQNRLVD